jgi:translation initiation factor IF-2
MSQTPRPPIVAVMGHIDHGKSSLLDYIRKSNIIGGEAGGITQHVSAYETKHMYEGVERTITFLDTPGHESFKTLRARGAQAADIAILIVGSDEGVKPQTKEAYNSIVESNLPFVVAFTKIDKNNSDIERAKATVLEAGIYLEGLGGDVPYAAISNKTGEGIPDLLNLVLLTADLNDISADASKSAEGFILESSQDSKRGVLATLIIKNGTLNTGEFVIAGGSYAPVRFIEDFTGARIARGLPSQPVVVSGWSTLPEAGTLWSVVTTKKEAEKLIAGAMTRPVMPQFSTDESRFVLPLIVKADVTGSLEAIEHELAKITHEDAVIRVIQSGVGRVTEGDIKTAISTGAQVIAFHVDSDQAAKDLAERSNIIIESYTIIYELAKRAEELLIERAPKVRKEEIFGTMKVLKVFSSGGKKYVIGARLESGEVVLDAQVKISRRGDPIGNGRITNIQQARADIKELRVLGEFGAQVESKEEVLAGDTLEAFKVLEV